MADNLGFTPGSGSTIKTDQGSGSSAHMQVIKLAESADGGETLIPATSANGLTVDVTRIQGNVTVVQGTATNLKVDASGVAVPVTDNAGSLTVDAPVGTPVAVRISTGSAFVDTIPVSIAGVVNIAGTVAISGTPSVAQSGTWNVGTVGTITNPVTVTGTVALSGTSPVSGTVTANQGTPVAIANAWNVKVGDGTNPVGVSTVSGSYALKVDVIQSVGDLSIFQDKTAFTEGTSRTGVIGGIVNDTPGTDPAEDQAAAVRITQKRALHVNIRKVDGTELGIAATPLRVDPTGSTTQPVSGTVTANQGGAPWSENITQIAGHAIVEAANGIAKVGAVDEAGAAFSETNPLPVRATYPEQTVWRATNTYGTSESDTAIFTPTGGKRFVLCGIIITVVTAGSYVAIHEGAYAGSKIIYKGSPPVGLFVIPFPMPNPASAINAVLRYSTFGAVVGDINTWGYEV